MKEAVFDGTKHRGPYLHPAFSGPICVGGLPVSLSGSKDMKRIKLKWKTKFSMGASGPGQRIDRQGLTAKRHARKLYITGKEQSHRRV